MGTLFSFASADTVYAWARCGYCNTGFCERFSLFNDGNCHTLPVDAVCLDTTYSYTLTSSNYFTLYRGAVCTSLVLEQYTLQCDSCYSYDANCNSWYMTCSLSWWEWMLSVLGILLVIGCCCACAIGGNDTRRCICIMFILTYLCHQGICSTGSVKCHGRTPTMLSMIHNLLIPNRLRPIPSLQPNKPINNNSLPILSLDTISRCHTPEETSFVLGSCACKHRIGL